ncbi:endonuclease/exonuclease/phosphatase family protein [Streptomyces pseudovenezuelae]|uniref:Endonuclease/exonuclease/phosphatase (EEP) superfamily protein YafD n=1 Tax=Streptomyces pseudovenezuelae TaxID=67350 RepID=A0ABT6LF64_9ACTN|nr:endonuclease/exonuclease/phosphatase family protein [Streptomyces pseudovenezuelae]MDH6214952.1 endonuclease/exonuclease/phosphatase (EEP) superfamily protein YafD [Streptomyces pseudovenezuelae]
MDTAAAEWTVSGDTPERHGGRRLAAWCAGLLFAALSLVVGCRVLDSDGFTPVPQVLAFLPWLLAPTGFALLLALLARWRIGLVWGIVLLGLLAWFIEPYGSADEPDGTPVAELRVLTSNVEFGQGARSLVSVLRREQPDIVFVEECEYTCQDTLEGTFGTEYPYRQAVRAGGSTGSIILSRFPLRATDKVPGTMGMPGAVAEVRGESVRLQLAHPMPPLPGQVDVWQRELGRLRDVAAADRDVPTILAGDFNASQDHAAFRDILGTGLRDAARLAGHDRTPSWPSRTAGVIGAQIDHVLVSRDFSASKARFLTPADTDHRALVVDITLHQRG